ncbi:MAG TPA: rhamnan synthesis F family protein [Chitinophagaceae bacterium]|nr:rhamnan synthesis F family protein [Chitinophagaceae bacterium]
MSFFAFLFWNSKAQLNLIKKSELFDFNWYQELYRDVPASDNGKIRHYIEKGVFEDRSPHPLFDTKWYRNFYGLGKRTNPFIHFILNSKTGDYNPNAFLNIKWYREIYFRQSDSGAVDLLNHFYLTGEKEYKWPSDRFDPHFYQRAHKEALVYPYGPLAHYIWHGRIKKYSPFESAAGKSHPLCVALHHVDSRNIILEDVLKDCFKTSQELKEYFVSSNRLPEDVPLRFQPESYTAFNSDLDYLKNKPLEAIRHFLKHGFKENRISAEFDVEEYTLRFYKIWNVQRNALLAHHPTIKTCVLVHIYYPELYDELRSYIMNLSGFDHDIYFNIVENSWSLALQKNIITDFPGAKIVISKNVGRDIGGFFTLLRYTGNVKNYGAYVLVHSKKSIHLSLSLADKWRKDLLQSILGSPEIILQNLYLLEKQPYVGLIGTSFWRHTSIDSNLKKYHQLMKILKIDKINQHCDYISGTMMWLKPEVIQYLYSKGQDLEFEEGNNKSIGFHIDGQWAHAIERAFGNICHQLSLKMLFR